MRERALQQKLIPQSQAKALAELKLNITPYLVDEAYDFAKNVMQTFDAQGRAWLAANMDLFVQAFGKALTKLEQKHLNNKHKVGEPQNCVLPCDVHCAFCGLAHHEVKKLFSAIRQAPFSANVPCICNDCVRLCFETLAAEAV